MKRALVLGLGVLLTVALVGCSGGTSNTKGGSDSGKGGGGDGDKRLNIGGATFIQPMMSKWGSEYYKAKNVKVNYNSVGSGTGINQMIARTYDFGCSDAPMNPKQLEKAQEKGGKVVHIPLAMGAVVPTYNLPGIEKPLRFTGEVLADIFLGKITKWNDPKLQKLQEEGVTLPDLGIAVVHRSDGSGTTYIFADYLAKCSSEWKENVGVNTSLKWPVGVGANGNEGVAGQVERTAGALGYNELIYALAKKNLKYGSVKNKADHYILGSLESVTKAADASLKSIPEDLRFSLTDAPGKDSYPISGTNWAVVYVHQPADKVELIKNFLTWVTHEGQEFCERLHYARLPQSLVERLTKKIELIKSAS
jgi:phosphate transport system substrate-binding protein